MAKILEHFYIQQKLGGFTMTKRDLSMPKINVTHQKRQHDTSNYGWAFRSLLLENA